MGILSGRQRMGAAALLLAASALLSRLMGLARDKIISWQFGASHEADMYFAAFVTPDIINYLLAGGFMSITIIPILGRLFQKNEQEGWKLFSCVVCWMCLGACVLTLIGEIWAMPISRIVAPGFTEEQLQRLAHFTRIILPGQIFFLTGATFTALLFLRRQFAVPALAPLIYNGCIILLGVTLPRILPVASDFGMTGYCIGVTLGAFLGAFLLPVTVALRGGIHFRPAWLHADMKKFILLALPLMLGQTVVMLDEQFLRIFGSFLGEGSISVLNYARRIAQVPVSLVGQAAAVASYPFLVKLLAENDLERFDETLNTALKTSLMLIVPLSLWMTAAAMPILGAIFEGGQFGPAQTLACAAPTRLMVAVAPVWIFYMIIVRAFYAHEDTLTPAITGTIITVICVPVYYLAAVPLGVEAIAAVSGGGLTIYAIWLSLIWRRRHGSGAFANLGKTAAKSLLCSLLPTLCAWYAITLTPVDFMQSLPFFGHCLKLALGGLAFIIVFMPLAWLLQPEILHKFAKVLLHKKEQKPTAS